MYLMLYPVLNLHVIGTLSYSEKAKNRIKHETSDHFQYCFRFMIHLEFATIFFSWICLFFCVALTQKLALDVWLTSKHTFSGKGNGIRLFYIKCAQFYIGDIVKYCGNTPFKTMLIFVRFTVELVTLTQ